MAYQKLGRVSSARKALLRDLATDLLINERIETTEAKAKELGYDVKVGKFPFSASGKARILGETDGFVKIVAEKKYDEVLGVHIIGPHATELLAEACVGMALETTADELGRIMHAHPTVSESVMEAAEGVHDLTIHM